MSRAFNRSAWMTGVASSPINAKSPVMAALPAPVGWKLISAETGAFVVALDSAHPAVALLTRSMTTPAARITAQAI